MKVRVKRAGLLGLTMHRKGEELDIEPDQFRTWMQPLDDEAKAVAASLLDTADKTKLDRAERELALAQARVDDLRKRLSAQPKRVVEEDVV